jgi:hypothetical protein
MLRSTAMIDIFRRVKGRDPIWLEAVEDSTAAFGRLIVLCAAEPGDYIAVCEAEIVSEVSIYEKRSAFFSSPVASGALAKAGGGS